MSKIFAPILAFTLIQTGLVPCALAQPPQPKAVVFDMGGVLFAPSKLGFFGHMGISNILNHMMRERLAPWEVGTTIKTRFFDLLETLGSQPTVNGIQVCDDNMVLPDVMCQWLAGRIDNQEVTKRILKKFGVLDQQNWFCSKYERDILKNLVTATFDPTVHAKHMKPIERGVELLHECKKCGYKIYILSNWAPEILAEMKRRYPELFAAVDGVVISGQADVQCLKPFDGIYQKLFEQFQLQPTQCYFIDDNQANIQAAQKLGMPGMWCPSQNFEIAREHLFAKEHSDRQTT